MKNRSEKILRAVLKNKNDLNLYKISKDFNLSERTIENDIDDINSYLKYLEQPLLFFDSDNLLKSHKKINFKVVIEDLNNFDINYYKFSKDERINIIYILLLWSDEYANMKKIADLLGVTRITILNDIKILKSSDSKKANVITDPGKGVILDIDFSERIDELIEMFNEISLMRERSICNDYLVKQMNIKINFNDILISVRSYFKEKNIVVDEKSLYDIVLYLFIVFNMQHKSKINREYIEKDTSQSLFSEVASKFNVDFYNADEINFQQFIKKNDIDIDHKEVDDLELYSVINHFLVKIDEKLNYYLSFDNVLIDSLVMHIKNMRDWGNLDIELPEVEKTIINYDELKSVIIDNVDILEAYLKYKLSENMIKSLIIHICVSIIRNNNVKYTVNVIIVCPGSMATGKLLELQIKRYFNFNIKKVLTVEELVESINDYNDIDFIISTIDIEEITNKYIKVSPILEMSDLNLIQDRALRRQHYNFIESKSNISSFSFESDGDKFNILKNILQPDIHVTDAEIDWKKAIFKSAESLLNKRYIDIDYINKSIENVEKYGDYIIIGYGTAIAHAGKKSGVYKDSLSLLISKNGVKFSENNTVYLLFFFASTGDEDYKNLYEILIKIARNREFVDQLRYEDSINAYRKIIRY